MDLSIINIANFSDPNKSFNLTFGAEPHIKDDFYIKWDIFFYSLYFILAVFIAKGYVATSEGKDIMKERANEDGPVAKATFAIESYDLFKDIKLLYDFKHLVWAKWTMILSIVIPFQSVEFLLATPYFAPSK